MRTVKFRAWQKNHQKIGRVKSISFNEKSEIEHLCFHNGDNCAPVYSNYWKNHKEWDLDNLELMQFTGLKDQKGKEIYEGDIVIYDRGVGNWTGRRMSTTHEIVFSDEVFAFVMKYGSSYIKLRKHWNYTYEVIGNIYENPELLSTPTAVL